MTASEADLVNALLSGETLRQFADSRQIRYETARTHLKNAMNKNGWRRQTEMALGRSQSLASSRLVPRLGHTPR